jgi:hypothetical protein
MENADSLGRLVLVLLFFLFPDRRLVAVLLFEHHLLPFPIKNKNFQKNSKNENQF